MLQENQTAEEKRKSELLIMLTEYGVSLEIFPYEWLCTTDFFRAPASAGHHAAHPGGLYEHSRNVAETLLDLTKRGVIKTWERPESPLIVGMLHDVTKIDMYKAMQDMNMATHELEIVYIKNPEFNSFGGHGYDSVCKIEQHMNLTAEERLCIRYHMGAYYKEDWDGYGKSIREYPNVLWTHTADMYASKVLEG